jgi:hypothetical protein
VTAIDRGCDVGRGRGAPRHDRVASLLDADSALPYRAYGPGEVDGNENHPGKASWKAGARCPPTGRRECRGRAARPRVPADGSAPRGARGGPGHQDDAPYCRGGPPPGHPPSAGGQPGHRLPESPATRRGGVARRAARATSPLRREHPGPPSLYLSPLRAHCGRRGTGSRTALARTVKTRGGQHRSHDHASPDRLLRSLPGVPGAEARPAGPTSSGGGCRCSRRTSFRAVSGRRHRAGWARGKLGLALCR